MGEEKHEDNEANDGIVHKVQYKALFNEHCRNYVPIIRYVAALNSAGGRCCF